MNSLAKTQITIVAISLVSTTAGEDSRMKKITQLLGLSRRHSKAIALISDGYHRKPRRDNPAVCCSTRTYTSNAYRDL